MQNGSREVREIPTWLRTVYAGYITGKRPDWLGLTVGISPVNTYNAGRRPRLHRRPPPPNDMVSVPHLLALQVIWIVLQATHDGPVVDPEQDIMMDSNYPLWMASVRLLCKR